VRERGGCPLVWLQGIRAGMVIHVLAWSFMC